MKDIEKLLRMTESPQDYSDEEIQQLMSNPDMQEYYELMVSAETGFAQRKKQRENRGDRSVILRIAAMFIGVLLLSSISFAAYRLVAGGNLKSPIQKVQIPNTSTSEAAKPSALQQTEDIPHDSIRTFENVELQQILQELSDFYHVGVDYRNEQTRHIRLYTKWDTTAPLHQIIERLNGFEKVSIRLSNNQIIAE